MRRKNENGALSSTEGQPDTTSSAAVASANYCRFTTKDIPPEGRFETWRDLWMRRLFEVEVSTDRPDNFEGNMELWSSGPLSIAQGEASRALYERTARFARNGSNDFTFAFSAGVDGHVSSSKTGAARVQRNGAFFLANDRSYRVAPANDYFPFCLLHINRDALLELMPRDFELALRTFAPGGNVLDLIRGTLPLITSKTEPMTQDRRETVGQQVIDLIALLLEPSRDGRARIEARGLKAARMGAVLQAVDGHFANPTLSADRVGRALGISARQVHRLLEETTKTFYEHLTERRLLHARGLLADPSRNGIKIAEIAFQAGFADVSHFNHAFRRRFGDTPTGVRNGAATELALRHLRQSMDGEAKRDTP
ncbi:MAG: helix-turn-helix transcriptional regulator [Methyloceanibacter sp.]|uniref:helix-turn-helix transcriptional regulator n=1 Tax=Methyloceanibacter sp. TaxID=1965321 RepID=UPI003D6D40B1